MIVGSNARQKTAGSCSIVPSSARTEGYRLGHYYRYSRQQKKSREMKILKEENEEKLMGSWWDGELKNRESKGSNAASDA